MKKRSLLSVALVLAMMFSLCSCGTTPADEGEAEDDVITITFGSPWWGESGRDVLWQGFAESFHEAYPQYKLEGIYIPYADFNDKMKTLVAAKEEPTIFYLQEYNFYQWLEDGYLAPIDECFDVSAVYDDLAVKESQDLVLHDGQYYGLVVETCPYSGLIYNKELFEANGVELPQNAEEYLELAKSLTNADGSQYGTIAANTSDNLNYIMQASMPYIMGFGGRIADEDGNFTVNQPEFVEGVEYYVELATLCSPAFTEYSTQRSVFFEGKVAMVSDGGYFIDWAAGENESLASNLDVAVLPMEDPATPTDLTYFGLSANATEEEKEAVGAFLSWWCTPEVQQAWIESCGYPVTMASAASEEYRAANEWYAVYENIAAYGIGLAVPGHEADSISIRNTVAEYIVECIEKTDADVQSIMDACKAELDAEFSS